MLTQNPAIWQDPQLVSTLKTYFFNIYYNILFRLSLVF
jgi:hypothetical protein